LLVVAGGAGSAQAAPASDADAAKALDLWTDAIYTGDPQKVGAVLAEEFQIGRSDGTGFDKAGYLENLPKQKKRSVNHDIVGTRAGALMVLRYLVDSDQTIAGKNGTGSWGRLSVFRADGDSWLLLSHANFTPLA
jgi:hypothetical protein